MSCWKSSLCLIVLCAPTGADAYTLRSSGSGQPIRWNDTSISFRVDQSLQDVGQASHVKKAILNGFKNWGRVGHSPFVFRGDGLPYEILGAGDRLDGVTDIIHVSQDWQHDSSFAALTLVTYDQGSGRILDADVLLNGAGFRFRVDPTPSEGYDLENVLTHEIGHLIGLGHAEEREATMYPTSEAGETKKRSLDADDEIGFQILYASTQLDAESAGCSTTPSGQPPAGAAAIVLLLLVVATLRLRQWRPAAVAAMIVIGLCAEARAAVVEYRSTAQLARDATDVLRGIVRSRRARWQDGVIVTDVAIDVVECWKGDCSARTRVVRELGGEVDGIGMLAPEPTALTVGTEAVLFARTAGRSRVLHLQGGVQAVFRIDPATEIAVRDLSGVEVPTGVGASESVSLRRLRRLVGSGGLEAVFPRTFSREDR